MASKRIARDGRGRFMELKTVSGQRGRLKSAKRVRPSTVLKMLKRVGMP